MFDLKVINAVLAEMEEERGISREKMLDAIEQSLATAYKKEFGKRGQIVTAKFDLNSGTTNFNQIKIVVDESMLKAPSNEEVEEEGAEEVATLGDQKVRFDEEKHIMVNNARMIKKDVQVGEELIFPLEPKDDFGRIAAQTAKQVIVQKIREAEKEAALTEFGQKAGDIVIGYVQRFERGNLYVDLGRVTAIMPYDEQIPGERYKPGERIRAILLAVEETSRGIFLKLSRAHANFLSELFAIEAPEVQSGAVVIKAVAREAGARSKIAVYANDQGHAIAEVASDQQSLAIGRGGQNVRLAAKLTGWKIDIVSAQTGEPLAVADATGPADIEADIETPAGSDIDVLENEDATTTNPALPNEDEPTDDRDTNPDTEEFNEIDTPEEAEALVADETEAGENSN